MKIQILLSAVVAVFTIAASASPAWSYRWGGYNKGLNALRYILPINTYRGNYNYGSNNGYYNYSRGFNFNNSCHHHHRRWW